MQVRMLEVSVESELTQVEIRIASVEIKIMQVRVEKASVKNLEIFSYIN